MKVYLDDERPTPEGWVGCRWPNEVIDLLEEGNVTHLSLDHDLGVPSAGTEHMKFGSHTGMEVLLWLEEQIGSGNWTKELPVITIHSANPVAQQKMNQALKKIKSML